MGDTNNMEKTIYIAEVSYGVANLTRLTVTKETPKMYILKKGSKESLIGNSYGYYGARILKDNKGIFFNPVDALKYLIDQLESYIKKTQEAADTAIVRASDERNKIEKLLLGEFE